MKILSVIPVLGVGGAEVVATALAVDARRRGYEIQLVSAGGFRTRELASAGIPHHLAPMDSRDLRSLARSAAVVRRICRAWRPDVIHAHNVKAALVARLGAGHSVPILTTVHGVPDAEMETGVRILRRTCDQVIAVSPHVAESVVAQGYPVSRTIMIENGVVPPQAHDKVAARVRLGLGPDGLVGLCLARLVDQKRHDLLIDAWARLPRGSTLLLAGDGPNRAAIEQRIRRHNLSSEIRVLGPRSDADVLLAAADFSVLSTDWEGMPISILEAMSAGLPVVATRVGGVLETLGSAIRLVEPGSVESMATALADVARSGSLREQLGRRGEALVAERFPVSRMLAHYRAAYDEVLLNSRRTTDAGSFGIGA